MRNDPCVRADSRFACHANA